MKKLTVLALTPTEVSREDIDRFRHALPDCKLILPDNSGDAGSGSFMPLTDQEP